MTSIDEAIAHAREVANEQKRRRGICVQNDSECDKFSACLKCYEEHEQIAEWLEELKAYKENQHRSLRHMYEKGYNKAIDDFAILMKETLNLSEQLKVGAGNGTDNQ